MKWSKLPWGWILAMVYVTVAPLIYGTVAFWPQMPELLHRLGGQTAAAWMQAIGSLAAIAVAIAVPWRMEVERQQGLAEASDLSYRNYVIWASSMAERTVQNLEALPRQNDLIRSGAPVRHLTTALEIVADDIGRLDPTQFPNWKVAVALHNIRVFALLGVEVLRKLSAYGVPIQVVEAELKIAAGALIGVLEARAEIHAVCRELDLPTG